MDSPSNIFLDFKERLDYLDNELVYQTHEDLGAETIPEQVSNSDQKQVWNIGRQGPGEVSILTSRRRSALIVVFALGST